MSDRASGGSGSDPLFKNMDEQEQIYAPEQIPGAVPVADEVDAGSGTAGNATHDPLVAGAEGDRRSTPVVAVRPDPSVAYPIPAPVTPGDDPLDAVDNEPR